MHFKQLMHNIDHTAYGHGGVLIAHLPLPYKMAYGQLSS